MIFVLLLLVNGPLAGMQDFLLPLLGFVATTIFLEIFACAQRNIKRTWLGVAMLDICWLR